MFYHRMDLNLYIEYISFQTAAHVVTRMCYQAFFETQA